MHITTTTHDSTSRPHVMTYHVTYADTRCQSVVRYLLRHAMADSAATVAHGKANVEFANMAAKGGDV